MTQCRYSGDCKEQVSRKLLFCRTHWGMVTNKTKDDVDRERFTRSGIKPDTLAKAIAEIDRVARKDAP